jgi:hypothetical protein
MTSLLVAASLLALGAPPGDVAPAPPRVTADPPMCLPTDVTFPVDATGPMPEAITIRFEIGDDGAAKDISIGFPVGASVSDLLVEAATQAVEYCTWVPAGEGSTEAVSRKVALRLPVVPAPTDRRTDPGGVKAPKMVEPDCFRGAFDIRPLVPKQKVAIVAKFPIFTDGKPGRARLLNQVDDPAIQERLERSITVAVKSCEWVPGKDGNGRPTLVYVLLPIRIY